MDVQKFLDLQYEKRAKSLSLDCVLSGDVDFDVWKGQVKESLRRHLGAFPEQFPPLNIQMLEEVPMPGVKMRRITYMSEEGLVTPAYYLRPEGAQEILPAVVAITGHGYGNRNCVGLNPDGTVMQSPEGDYTHKFALRLCERGFAVIAPEPLGFGDLRLPEDVAKGPGASSCNRIDSFLTMLGRTTGGVRVVQAMRAIDVLESLGGVDMSRIGIMGISGGGLVSEFTTVLDERIKACVISGYANTFRDSVMAVPHCVDNFFMGLVNELEMPDILASIAPRPMLWEAGSEDPIFPFYAVEKAYAQVREIYAHVDAEDCLALDAFEGDHMISGVKAYDFLWDALKV